MNPHWIIWNIRQANKCTEKCMAMLHYVSLHLSLPSTSIDPRLSLFLIFQLKSALKYLDNCCTPLPQPGILLFQNVVWNVCWHTKTIKNLYIDQFICFPACIRDFITRQCAVISECISVVFQKEFLSCKISLSLVLYTLLFCMVVYPAWIPRARQVD